MNGYAEPTAYEADTAEHLRAVKQAWQEERAFGEFFASIAVSPDAHEQSWTQDALRRPR